MPANAATLPSNRVFVSAEASLFENAPELVYAAAEGVQDVTNLMASAMDVRIISPYWKKGPYGSVSWFVGRSMLRRESSHDQVVWNTLHRDLESDPTRQSTPHSGYMLMEQDMTALGSDGQPFSFIFGATRKDIAQSVQSVYRFRRAKLSHADLTAATRHVARHEFGHLIGLDSSSIRNQDGRGDLYTDHCLNECTMQQVVSVSEAIAVAKNLRTKPHAGFCADCTSYARSV